MIQSSQLNKGGIGTLIILNIEYWCDADTCLQILGIGVILIDAFKTFHLVNA